MTDLRPLYRQMADRGQNFHGLSILPHMSQIGRMVLAHKAKTILDFGCGRGDAYEPPYEIHKAWGVEMPFLYDPAFEAHENLPPEGQKFDGVICSDVLEHVPEDEIVEFVRGLFKRADRFVWASVCTRAAKKHFPDGQNLHVTIQRYRWWHKIFLANQPAGVDWLLTQTP